MNLKDNHLDNDILSKVELNAIMEAIKNRYGMDFSNYEQSSLLRGLRRVMLKKNIKNAYDLWFSILGKTGFIGETIDDLFINLTELFRNPEVWILLRNKVLLNLLDGKKTNKIKIWHVGCSTGEEVLSMAIILEDMGLLDKSYLLGTDVSHKALKLAIKGRYIKKTIKNHLSPLLKCNLKTSFDRYFDYIDDYVSVKQKYLDAIEYKRQNVVETLPICDDFDIVFCRNVMIYFNEKLRSSVLNRLHQTLKPGGYLIIGYYDSLPLARAGLFDSYDSNCKVYRKKILQ